MGLREQLLESCLIHRSSDFGCREYGAGKLDFASKCPRVRERSSITTAYEFGEPCRKPLAVRISFGFLKKHEGRNSARTRMFILFLDNELSRRRCPSASPADDNDNRVAAGN